MGKPWKNFKPDAFVYGTCHSDHKRKHKYKGHSIDYFYLAHTDELPEDIDWDDKEMLQSAFVCDVFEKLGLPLPSQHDVHYGSDGSLLFLNSHGVVIRIHENCDGDPRFFLHPHILQPLGWVTCRDLKTTVAIYPAVHLFPYSAPLRTIRKLEDSFFKSGFRANDLDTVNNIGYLALEGKKGATKRFPIALDISARIGEEKSLKNHKSTRDAFAKKRKTKPAFEALKVAFRHSMFTSSSNADCYEAFHYHQPLRHAFFMAWPKADKEQGEPNPERMKKFWQMAYNYAHKGYKICKKDTETGEKFIKETRRNPLSWRKNSFKKTT